MRARVLRHFEPRDARSSLGCAVATQERAYGREWARAAAPRRSGCRATAALGFLLSLLLFVVLPLLLLLLLLFVVLLLLLLLVVVVVAAALVVSAVVVVAAGAVFVVVAAADGLLAVAYLGCYAV